MINVIDRNLTKREKKKLERLHSKCLEIKGY